MTVLDVGVDEVGFGADGGQSGCTTHNFFEELYPWQARITAVGLHDGSGFRAGISRDRLRPGRRIRPSVSGRRVRRPFSTP